MKKDNTNEAAPEVDHMPRFLEIQELAKNPDTHPEYMKAMDALLADIGMPAIDKMITAYIPILMKGISDLTLDIDTEL